MPTRTYPFHFSREATVDANPEAVFAFLDDPTHLSAHMGKSSWMMGGGSMKTKTDEGKGMRLGSHMTMDGRAFGMRLFLDETVVRHEPPTQKSWETVGNVRLLVIGHYRLGFEIKPQKRVRSLVRVSIDYGPDASHPLLSRLLGGWYAKWCVEQMLQSAKRVSPSSIRSDTKDAV